MTISIKILTEAEAKAYQQTQTDNMMFTQDTIDIIMKQRIQPDHFKTAFGREIANAQTLLNTYKEVLGLKDNVELFKHIKEQNNVADGLDYALFQTYLQTIARAFKWGPQRFGVISLKQYNLNQTYIYITQWLNNKRYQKYDPNISLQNTENYENLVIETEHKRAISERARKNGSKSSKNYKADFFADAKAHPDRYKITKRGDRTRIYRYMKVTFNIKDKRTQKKYLDEYLASLAAQQ